MKRKVLALTIVLVIFMQVTSVAFARDNTEYYSEDITCIGESSLSIIADSDVAEYFQSIQDDKGYDPVVATKQTVYIVETFDKDGSIYASRLMTDKEVAEYKKYLSNNPTKSNIWVGDDGETHQGNKLSIYLVVYKDTNRNYYAYGTADWANGIYSGGVNGPSYGYDFISITWGAGGELMNSSSSDRSISGRYQYDQGSISFSRANSDTYRGYCWQFDEIKPVGLTNYFADYIDSYVKLKKTSSTYFGKQTNIRMTYVHTYQSAVGSISFSGGSSGAAASVSLSSCDKQWQIEIDVPGIYY